MNPKCFSAVASDTETTGLDVTKQDLVGISFAFDAKSSIYIPVGHKVGSNVDQDLAMEFSAMVFKRTKKILFYNRNFDHRFFEKGGIGKYLDLLSVPFFDIAVLVWNADTNVKMPSLK